MKIWINIGVGINVVLIFAFFNYLFYYVMGISIFKLVSIVNSKGGKLDKIQFWILTLFFVNQWNTDLSIH